MCSPYQAVRGVVFDNAAGSDDVAARRLSGFARGVVVRYERELGAYIDVLLYQFEDEEGARTYAERLAEHLGARRAPNAPRPPIELPYSGIDVCGLESPGCTLAGEVEALDVEGRDVVGVSAVDYGEGSGDEPPAAQALDLVTTILEAQAANL